MRNEVEEAKNKYDNYIVTKIELKELELSKESLHRLIKKDKENVPPNFFWQAEKGP